MVLVSAPPANGAEGPNGKVPITTASQEARQAYLKGRDLLEKLRGTDARAHFAKAAELDPAFALAQLGLANTAPAGPEFFAALRRATALAEKASEGEAHMIRALEAGVNGQPEVVRQHLTALVRAYPQDERAHNLLATSTSAVRSGRRRSTSTARPPRSTPTSHSRTTSSGTP
jgi:hypothetical protein